MQAGVESGARDARAARRGGRATLPVAFCCAAAFAALVACAAKSHVEETVTTRPRAAAPAPSITTPPRDAEYETSGDRVAHAFVSLRRHEGDAALRDLGDARRIIASRARLGSAEESAHDSSLERILRDMDAAEQSIRGGAPDRALEQLTLVGDELDRLDY